MGLELGLVLLSDQLKISRSCARYLGSVALVRVRVRV